MTETTAQILWRERYFSRETPRSAARCAANGWLTMEKATVAAVRSTNTITANIMESALGVAKAA